MAIEADNPVASAPLEPTDGCSCDHSQELSDELKAILTTREEYWDNPEDFRHDQVPFLGFEVDSKLRSIIENLWIMGLPTDFSCEGFIELCHSELPSRDFYSQIIFLRLRDAVRFYALITELFGAGALYAPEGFALNAMEGDVDDLFENGDQGDPSFLSRVNARARGEVTFNPHFIEHISAVLDDITSAREYDIRRSELDIAEDLDEAYEILGVSPEIRELAERDCSCGHDH